jgi:colanic acid/amylovoran biosynthesis glycosyltransferase
MKNLTVLHSFPTWLPQTQTWMHSQVSELQKLGVDAHVVCERTLNLDQFIVNNIHCLATENIFKKKWDQGLRKLGVRQHLNFLVEVGKKTNATILHSHFGNIGWASLGAVRKLDVKHVVTFYGFDVNKLPTQEPVWRKRYRQLFEEADLFLCEGSHMARCLVELGCPEHKVKVQHLGVDVERFELKPRQWNAGEPLKILIAASFNEKKGIPYALEALGIVSKEIPIELTIIGDARPDVASQQEKAKICNLLESTGLKAHTRLLGYQPHTVMMREAYAHHIFLHPSVTAADGDTEGGAPVSIIEMLATGMPVVSTTHCDIPEVMGPELHHLLAPERNASELASRVNWLIESQGRWGEVANAGRQRVLEQYHQEVQGERLLANYSMIG